MQQYNRIKVKHPDTILLFRVGDFYETFGEDAVVAAKVLGIILAKRGNGSASEIELAGFPHHSLDTYLPKLVRAGLKVAVCDQLEDPKQAKGLVKRGVTELVTPGVVMHDQVLETKENHYLAALHWTPKGCGVAFMDISTGDFLAAEGDAEWIDRLLRSLSPKEWVCQKQHESDLMSLFGDDIPRSKLDDWVFTEDFAKEKLHRQFGTKSLKGFGLHDATNATIAAGVILQYLEFTHHTKLGHLQGVKRLRKGDGMWLDRFTVRNLEIIYPSHPDGTSLAECLDRTSTPMGGRMLRRHLVMPLTDRAAIETRHAAVAALVSDTPLRVELKEILCSVGDLERLASKASSARINPRELVQLKRGLVAVINVAEAAAGEEDRRAAVRPRAGRERDRRGLRPGDGGVAGQERVPGREDGGGCGGGAHLTGGAVLHACDLGAVQGRQVHGQGGVDDGAGDQLWRELPVIVRGLPRGRPRVVRRLQGLLLPSNRGLPQGLQHGGGQPA